MVANQGDERDDTADRDSAWREFLAELEIDPDNPEALYKAGMILVDQHRYAEALPYLQRGVAGTPDAALAQHNLGQALFHLGRFNDALPHLQRAAQLDADEPSVHYLLSRCFQQLNRPAEAEAELGLFEKLGKRQKDKMAERVSAEAEKRRVRGDVAADPVAPAAASETPRR